MSLWFGQQCVQRQCRQLRQTKTLTRKFTEQMLCVPLQQECVRAGLRLTVVLIGAAFDSRQKHHPYRTHYFRSHSDICICCEFERRRGSERRQKHCRRTHFGCSHSDIVKLRVHRGARVDARARPRAIASVNVLVEFQNMLFLFKIMFWNQTFVLKDP